MGLLRLLDASEGGAISFFIIYAALYIAMVMDLLIFLLREMGLKVNTEITESSDQTLWSYAYAAQDEDSDLGRSGVAQLAMTAEEIGDWLPVSLLEASSSSDVVSECVVCLKKFDGGEEIRSLPCSHVFHKSCVDKWLLDYDYENMTCPVCRQCLATVPLQRMRVH